MLKLVFAPPSHTFPPLDPSQWRDESLFAGEAVVHAAFAVIAPDDRWATGFRYLTNFRMIFVPVNTLTPFLPAGEVRHRPSVSIRLTHIADMRLRGSRLDVVTDDLVYTFAFAQYTKPIVTTGDARGHKPGTKRFGNNSLLSARPVSSYSGMDMASEAETIKEAIDVENHAHAVVLAALNDKEFMRGVLEAKQQDAEGSKGESWSSVKARLGIA